MGGLACLHEIGLGKAGLVVVVSHVAPFLHLREQSKSSDEIGVRRRDVE